MEPRVGNETMREFIRYLYVFGRFVSRLSSWVEKDHWIQESAKYPKIRKRIIRIVGLEVWERFKNFFVLVCGGGNDVNQLCVAKSSCTLQKCVAGIGKKVRIWHRPIFEELPTARSRSQGLGFVRLHFSVDNDVYYAMDLLTLNIEDNIQELENSFQLSCLAELNKSDILGVITIVLNR